MSDETTPSLDKPMVVKCDGSRDPRRRCGLHHGTDLPWFLGGLECCCGDSWLGVRNICSSGAEPGTSVSLKDRLDSLISWAGTAEERQAVADIVFAQLPPDGRGRWRQGTKNPRNLYVHQGDDETGQPVGQMYSAELAALVCDAVNGQRERAEQAEAERDRLDVRMEEIVEGFKNAHRHHRTDQSGTLCTTCHTRYPCPTARALDAIGDQASDVVAERDQLKATIARVKALAEKLIATGDVSIGGIWSDHNIEIGRDILATLDRSDLPAVREFVAGFDPRKEGQG